MTAVARRPSPPSPDELQAAQSVDTFGAGGLIRGYVNGLRMLFEVEAGIVLHARGWQRAGQMLQEIHQQNWSAARAAWGASDTPAKLTELAIAQGDWFAGVLAAAPDHAAATAGWHAAVVDLTRDMQTWEMHAGATYAAFGFMTAVGWLGLRHCAMAGVHPSAIVSGLSESAQPPPEPAPERGTMGVREALAGVDQVLSPVLAEVGKRAKEVMDAYRRSQAEQRAMTPQPQNDPRTRDTVTPPTMVSEPTPLQLDASRLGGSILPTWLMLVGLSWVSLIWGALISLPFGVGLAIFATMFAGFVSVPLWGTVFGFLGMGAARDSTLRQMGFEDLEEGHELKQTAARYAQILDIPPPRLGTMEVRNAFAMGTNRADATVAIGRPLINTMRAEEVNAILGHELGHVVSGDMRKMMLMRTFQNATVWFGLTQGLKQFARWVICWAAELAILAFSRRREYWADAIGAALAGKEAMIGALKKLEQAPVLSDTEATHARFMFRGTLSTHPTMAQRIDALERETYIQRLPRRATGR